jgi:hypothetical protein
MRSRILAGEIVAVYLDAEDREHDPDDRMTVIVLPFCVVEWYRKKRRFGAVSCIGVAVIAYLCHNLTFVFESRLLGAMEWCTAFIIANGMIMNHDNCIALLLEVEHA